MRTRRRWRSDAEPLAGALPLLQLLAASCPRRARQCAAPYLDTSASAPSASRRRFERCFPEARVGRVDRDTVRRRGSLDGAARSVRAARELDVLVGTQMIAKGHDFPQVTLVGVISADVGLGLADFRAAERTFQLLTQVAGRAGRGEQAGEAIDPDAVSVALQHPPRDRRRTTPRSSSKEIDVPPHDALPAGDRDGQCRRARQDATTRRWKAPPTSRAGPASASAGGFVILGPAPAPLTRLRGEHRAQFFLKGHRAGDAHALRAALESLPALARRVSRRRSRQCAVGLACDASRTSRTLGCKHAASRAAGPSCTEKRACAERRDGVRSAPTPSPTVLSRTARSARV